MRKQSYILLAVLLAVLLAAAGVLVLLDAAAEPAPQLSRCDLLISEVCAKNETVIANNNGRYSDYVELYNEGPDVDLQGFRFSNGNATSAPLGDILLKSGEYRVIFLGEADMGLTLSSAGLDCLQLLDAQGYTVTQVNTVSMAADHAMVWLDGAYRTVSTPSPGFANDETGIHAFREGFPRTDAKLVINELLTGNVCALPGESGKFSDYAELKNLSGEELDLGGYWLSDDPERRFAFRLPDMVLAPGGHLVVCCDGGSQIDSDGTVHANFSLAQGETLYLTDRQGGYVTLTVQDLGDDVSLARREDGSYEPQPPSLGFANHAEGQYLFARSRIDPGSPLLITEVLLSGADVPYGGRFCDVVELTNRTGVPVSTAGWYLSDGSDPYAYPLPPQTLKPGECIAVACTRQSTGFSLSQGETVYLLSPNLSYAFPAVCAAVPGQSLHLTDQVQGAFAFAEPSPGFPDEQSWHEATLPDGLRISEVMSANAGFLQGPYGESYDWLELYNAGDFPVSLAEYCLSNDPDDLSEHTLPNVTVEPGAYCVLLLTNSQVRLPEGYQTVRMSLSSQGEALYLSRDGQVTDWTHIPRLALDTAWGRAADHADFSLVSAPTPGSPNSGAAQRCAIPIALTPQGVYDDTPYLDVVLEGEGQLYYTTDATLPGPDAKLYTGPIRLTASTVLRVVSRRDGCMDSESLDLTYLLNENDQLPVVALVSEPEGLWSDESGIYAMGPNAKSFYPYFGANFHQDWERAATISMFELDGTGFTAGCGIKIHGAYSRGEAKKSLAVHFRDIYGCSRLDYPIFGNEGLDSYESFLLRSGGQDADMGRMRNVLITSIAADYTRVAVQKYRAVVVYINGEYFGVHYIRDKVNEQFVAGYCNADVEDVILCEGNGTTSQEYRDLVRYAATHSLNKEEYYAYMDSQMDLEVYMDYIITQICIANTDNSNVKFFKTPDTKWHWVLYDTDLSMFQSAWDSVSNHLNPSGTGGHGSTSTTLINRLLRSEKFREAFLHRFGWHMSTVWTEENINARIDELVALIETDMVKDCQRWEMSYHLWQEHVQIIRNFAHRRTRSLLQFVREYFDLSTAEMRQYGFPV